MTFPVSAAEFTAAYANSIDSDHLDRLLDAAEQEINRYAGPISNADSGNPQGQVREIITLNGPLLLLSRRAESIVSVVEGFWTATTLAADDYELLPDGMTLRRLSTGTHSAVSWGERVDVVYVPLSDIALREMVQIELAKLDIAFTPGLASQTIGSWAESYVQGKSQPEQRMDILARLDNVTIGIW